MEPLLENQLFIQKQLLSTMAHQVLCYSIVIDYTRLFISYLSKLGFSLIPVGQSISQPQIPRSYIYIYLVFIFIYKSAECTKARITLTFSVIKIKKILIALLPVIFIKYYSSSNIPSVVLYPFKMFCSFVLLSALSVQVFLNQRQNGSL